MCCFFFWDSCPRINLFRVSSVYGILYLPDIQPAVTFISTPNSYIRELTKSSHTTHFHALIIKCIVSFLECSTDLWWCSDCLMSLVQVGHIPSALWNVRAAAFFFFLYHFCCFALSLSSQPLAKKCALVNSLWCDSRPVVQNRIEIWKKKCIDKNVTKHRPATEEGSIENKYNDWIQLSSKDSASNLAPCKTVIKLPTVSFCIWLGCKLQWNPP